MKLFYRTVMGMLVAASVASADVTFQDFTANFPDVGELPPLITSFENGRVFNANISIAPADGGSNVTVIVTNEDASAVSVPFDNYFVEGLSPYDGRISFGARTGGASGSHDVDNISLRINGSQVQTEGFDSVDEDWIDTNFADPSFFPYDTDDGFLRLTEEGINSTLSSVALPAAHAGTYDLLEVSFDFRVSQGAGGGADGVSFAYVPVADFGDEGFVPAYSEEPNLVGSLGVGFDTFNNTDLGDGGENSVSLHWDATTLSSVSIDTGLLEIDPPAVVGGTPFTQSTFGVAAGLGLRSDNGGIGVQQGYARLADEAAGNGSFLAFDKTSDSTESITAEFSFRISDVDGTRADGMAFVLAPTSTYGDSGELEPANTDWNPAEEPGLLGALGIGFDTFQSDGADAPQCDDCGGDVANEFSLHFDDLIVDQVQLPLADIDLVSGEYHKAVVTAVEDGNDMLVSLVVTDGTDGSVHVIFDSVSVGGTFDGPVRAAFGARTGGAADNFDVDDICIDFGDGGTCGGGGLVGDFNLDGSVTTADLDVMVLGDGAYDVTGDGAADAADLNEMVANLIGTWIGDSNGDGEFSSGDFVQVFGVGKFETGEAATWSEGDWNLDGQFTTSDFVAAFTEGGYELGPRGGVSAVPEPSSMVLVLAGLFGLAGLRRRRS